MFVTSDGVTTVSAYTSHPHPIPKRSPQQVLKHFKLSGLLPDCVDSAARSRAPRRICNNSTLTTVPTRIIEVENLKKRYEAVEAIRGISFHVDEGEVFGLLGPNGAGKTSCVEILEGLRTPDSGTVSVCGINPQSGGNEYKQLIGGVLQSTALPDKMKVREAIELFSGFYERRRSVDDLIKRFGLQEKQSAYIPRSPAGKNKDSLWRWRCLTNRA